MHSTGLTLHVKLREYGQLQQRYKLFSKLEYVLSGRNETTGKIGPYWKATLSNNPYIEVNLMIPHSVYAIATEGHSLTEFVHSYSLATSYNCSTFNSPGVSEHFQENIFD